jgi:hypothetical protein
MSVGDVQSAERGSGARYNNGKPPVDLIPVRLIGEQLARQDNPASLPLIHLGEFQVGGGADSLYQVIEDLGPAWDECAAVFDYGRKKYAAWNWAKGMAWSIPIACATRHILFGLARGEVNDPESGLPHRGHVLCNVVMLLTYLETYPEGDDRPVQWLSRKVENV